MLKTAWVNAKLNGILNLAQKNSHNLGGFERSSLQQEVGRLQLHDFDAWIELDRKSRRACRYDKILRGAEVKHWDFDS